MRSCSGCSKTGPFTTRCPKCSSLGLPDAWFCSKECFNAAWKEHSKEHKDLVFDFRNRAEWIRVRDLYLATTDQQKRNRLAELFISQLTKLE